MKKYKLFSLVFVLALILLIGFKFANASDTGCNGGLYSVTTGQPCNASATLQIGSRGEAVKTFQQTLKNAGFLAGKVDGIYGGMTSAAATAYYKIHPISIIPSVPCTDVTGTTCPYTEGKGFYPPTTPTLVPSFLSTPTIVASASTSAQNLVVGSTGVTNATKATFNFVSTGGVSTITGLTFDSNTTFNAISSITINGVTAYTADAGTVFAGLNIPIYPGASGTNVTAYISYSGVGENLLYPIPSGSKSNIQLGVVKYTTSANTPAYLTGLAVQTPIMTLVSVNLPAGCTSNSGYSTTNGVACDGTISSTVVGCSKTTGYSSTSGLACDGSGTHIPNSFACTATSTFNPYTGEYCPGKAPATTPTPAPVCSNVSDFNPYTGELCGCANNATFNPATGEYCSGKAPAPTPTPPKPVCANPSDFDPTTGASCACYGTAVFNPLTGEACKK